MNDAREMLELCPFCKKPPGTKVGPPALARCITPDCPGKNLAAETFNEWNTRTASERLAATAEWPEITKEQVEAIDRIAAPELEKGNWVSVEGEATPDEEIAAIGTNALISILQLEKSPHRDLAEASLESIQEIRASERLAAGTGEREKIAEMISHQYCADFEEDACQCAQCEAERDTCRLIADRIITLFAPAALSPQEAGQRCFDRTVEAERKRCLAICEGWIGTFQDREIKYTSAREYAVDAIEDIIDLIRDGHQPSVSSTTRNTDAEPSRCKNPVARGESMEADALTGDAPVASASALSVSSTDSNTGGK